MKCTPIILATTLALLLALPAAAQTKKKPVRRAAPVVVPLLPPADSAQLAAAALTLFGDYACEFGKSIRVSRNPKFEGYFDLLFNKQLFTLKPVLSYTGALRLEDVRGRLLLVQIADVSMVMDVKIGQRVVDDCVHATQSENRRQMAAAPARPGLGIDPSKSAADAAVQAASAAAAAAVAAAAAASAPVQAAVVAPALPASAAASAAEQAASAAPAPAASGVGTGTR